jgi:hypothetical protein
LIAITTTPLRSAALCSVVWTSTLMGAVSNPPCLHDTDGDGHPLFAATARRGIPTPALNPTNSAAFRGMCVRDIDADGRPDVVGTGTGKCGTIGNVGGVVLRGLPDGTFEEATLLPGLWVSPQQAALADLNGDGHFDLVMVDRLGCAELGRVLILWGDGTAAASGFEPGPEYVAGFVPGSLDIADLNGDGLLDLAVLNFGDVGLATSSVTVLINAGNGFFPPQTFPTPAQEVIQGNSESAGPFIRAMDIDRDGDHDLAVPMGYFLRFLINDGLGAFSPGPIEFKSPKLSSFFAPWAGDLNGDGLVDVASVQKSSANQLCVWLGRVGGGYTSGEVYGGPGPIPCSGRAIEACDIDHDGDIDLASGDFGWGVVVHRNAGDGTFPDTQTVLNTRHSVDIALADADGDGWEDLLVLETWPRAQVVVARNDRAGRFREPAADPVIVQTNVEKKYDYQHAAAADLDNDGDLDLVTTTSKWVATPTPPVGLRLNNGLGQWTYQDVGVFPADTQLAEVMPVDLTGDGSIDLVVSDITDEQGISGPGRFWVMIAKGGGTFGLPTLYAFDDAVPAGLASGDFDADGDIDVAVWTCGLYAGEATPVPRHIRVFTNDGQGTLTAIDAVPLGSWTWHPSGAVIAADLDADGVLDLAGTATPTGVKSTFGKPGAVVWARGLGGALFEVQKPVEVAFMAKAMAAVPTVGQGHALVVGHATQPGDPLQMYPLEGVYKTVLRVVNGELKLVATYAEPGREHREMTVVADINGDRLADITGLEDGPRNVSVMLGRKDGTFDTPFTYEAGSGACDVVVGSFDADQTPDAVVIANVLNDCITLLRNEACEPAPCIADCDGTGTLDIEDFVCFQTYFALGDTQADCDASGSLDIDDFICFQTNFVLGC